MRAAMGPNLALPPSALLPQICPPAPAPPLSDSPHLTPAAPGRDDSSSMIFFLLGSSSQGPALE